MEGTRDICNTHASIHVATLLDVMYKMMLRFKSSPMYLTRHKQLSIHKNKQAISGIMN